MTNRNQLLDAINRESLSVGDQYQLSTGAPSAYYFDCKKVTLNGKWLSLVVDLVLEAMDQLPSRPSAIGGLTIGADPIISGVILRAPHLQGSIVRKERKKHGTKNRIENQLPAGTKIVVVDDVITSGSSTETACNELQAADYDIIGIIALIDREAGGLEHLRKRFGHAVALFTKSDFPKLRNDNKTQEQLAVRVG